MMETPPENDSKGWKKFLRKHWHMLVLFSVGAALAAVGALYVFLWFIGDALSTGLVPTILGQWSMAHMLTFLLHVIFWEALFIGIPVILAAVAGWLWWRRLPIEEKKEYHFFGAGSRSTGGGGAISILFWIAFAIKIFTDGNWNVPVATWTLDYFVYSSIWTLIWIVIIFGIPALVIGLIWWLSQETKKP